MTTSGFVGAVPLVMSAVPAHAATGSGGLSAVSAGISEALVETALGLAVAIPVVLGFNYLSAQIARDEQTLAHASGELLDTIEGWDERPPRTVERTSYLTTDRSRVEGNA